MKNQCLYPVLPSLYLFSAFTSNHVRSHPPLQTRSHPSSSPNHLAHPVRIHLSFNTPVQPHRRLSSPTKRASYPSRSSNLHPVSWKLGVQALGQEKQSAMFKMNGLGQSNGTGRRIVEADMEKSTCTFTICTSCRLEVRLKLCSKSRTNSSFFSLYTHLNHRRCS